MFAGIPPDETTPRIVSFSTRIAAGRSPSGVTTRFDRNARKLIFDSLAQPVLQTPLPPYFVGYSIFVFLALPVSCPHERVSRLFVSSRRRHRASSQGSRRRRDTDRRCNFQCRGNTHRCRPQSPYPARRSIASRRNGCLPQRRSPAQLSKPHHGHHARSLLVLQRPRSPIWIS